MEPVGSRFSSAKKGDNVILGFPLWGNIAHVIEIITIKQDKSMTVKCELMGGKFKNIHFCTHFFAENYLSASIRNAPLLFHQGSIIGPLRIWVSEDSSSGALPSSPAFKGIQGRRTMKGLMITH